MDNANGGTASAGDWTMNVAGPTPLSFPGVESPGTKNTVNAGDYTVTESGGPSNYTLTYSGDCDSTGHVNIPPFHDRVCTLTNTAKPGNIVVKKVTNPGGDQQAFTFSPSYGSSFQLADGQQNDSGSLKAGTYSVAETAVSGWDQTSATCDDGSSPSSISLSSGETVTCTFTNTKHGNLIVVKHVSNTHGGSSVASNWSMHVKQNGSDISGSPFAGAESPVPPPRSPQAPTTSASRVDRPGTRSRIRATATRAAMSPSLRARRRPARSRTVTSRRR